MQYDIIWSSGLRPGDRVKKVTEEVNERLSEGWELYGEPKIVITNTVIGEVVTAIYQPIIKKED